MNRSVYPEQTYTTPMISPNWVLTYQSGIEQPPVETTMDTEVSMQPVDPPALQEEEEEEHTPTEEPTIIANTTLISEVEQVTDVSARRKANQERKLEFAQWREGIKEELGELRQEVSAMLGR